MRIFKSHPLLKLVNSYVVDSPQPSNLSYLWNFGSLLAVCLIIQIITGVTLAMHYNPNILEAFNSVEHIMRDVNNGWLIRYLHSNTASAFFFIVYLHIGRGLYYGSYKAPRTLVWTIGTIIFIAMVATAFLGYAHSPKWFYFNSNISFNNLYIAYNILSLFGLLSFVFFYLDGFKLSNIYYIKVFQLLSLFSILIGFLVCYQLNSLNFLCINDNDNVNLHGHVDISKDAAIEISKGMSAVGNNIGLGGTIIGVGTAVGKVIAKSGIPPLQKAGIVMAGSIVGGVTHSIISRHNRNEILYQNPNNYTNSLPKNINKFLDNDSYTPLEGMFSDMQVMSITLLGLIGILIIQLIIKLHLKEKILLKLHRFIGVNINDKLEYYINKIIILNKNMNTIYIWLIIIILIVGLFAILITNINLLNNIDKYISVHNNLKK